MLWRATPCCRRGVICDVTATSVCLYATAMQDVPSPGYLVLSWPRDGDVRMLLIGYHVDPTPVTELVASQPFYIP